MKDYIVVGYYTKNTIYEKAADKLIDSMLKFKVPHHIENIRDMGGWYANTNYKPTFLKKMMLKYPSRAVVYVDCDAEFKLYPELFDKLGNDDSVNVAVYVFDRSLNYQRSAGGTEVLSGTVFLQNNKKVLGIIDKWVLECRNNPRKWDQKSLEKVLDGDFTLLPGEYCHIFDRDKHIKNPVIVHYQASRKVRENDMKIK